MGIDLGLFRIKNLLSHLGNPQLSGWRVAAHVAGTNGKGSVCSYVSSTLSGIPGLKIGKFTSPHLISVNDSICINEKPVSRQTYDSHKFKVCRINKIHNINATEFELHTAVAFDLFTSENIDFAVLEVGLGGKLDSTNVIPSNRDAKSYGVLVTGITKIAMDHESILGSTIQEIATQKAGIIKPNVPCVIDASNEETVIDTVGKIAKENNSPLILAYKDDCVPKPNKSSANSDAVLEFDNIKSSYQFSNISVAINILQQLKQQFLKSPATSDDVQIAEQITPELIHDGIVNTTWPGRLQNLDFKFTNKEHLVQTIPVLLDGAHNESAAIELKNYIDDHFGNNEKPITYILSMTSSKDIRKILKPILKDCKHKNFNVILTNFDYSHGVEDMPWIKSYDTKVLKQFIVDQLGIDSSKISINKDVNDVFSKNNFDNRSVIIFGSLYLVGEILRIHESNI